MLHPFRRCVLRVCDCEQSALEAELTHRIFRCTTRGRTSIAPDRRSPPGTPWTASAAETRSAAETPTCVESVNSENKGTLQSRHLSRPSGTRHLSVFGVSAWLDHAEAEPLSACCGRSSALLA